MNLNKSVKAKILILMSIALLACLILTAPIIIDIKVYDTYLVLDLKLLFIIAISTIIIFRCLIKYLISSKVTRK